MPKNSKPPADADEDQILVIHDLLLLAADAQENPDCPASRLEAQAYTASALSLARGIIGGAHV